jgi:hypothetical protein
MNDSNTIDNLDEARKQADVMADSVLDWGIGPLLNAQSDMLAGAEATVGDWLRRRHEAIADTQQLIARIHTGGEPGDAVRAQREWVSRSFRRLAADADACRTVARRLMDRAPSWFPQRGFGLPPGDAGRQ